MACALGAVLGSIGVGAAAAAGAAGLFLLAARADGSATRLGEGHPRQTPVPTRGDGE
jgi:hypothetical protein